MSLRALCIALYGVIFKEVVRFLDGWPQTLLPSAVTTVLYFLVFGEVMGSKIGPMQGVSYTVFITPGLVMLAVITNAYANVVSSFYGSRFNRSIEEMLISPMPNPLIIIGFMMGGVVRALLVGLIVIAISLWFSGLHMAHWGWAVGLILLCSMLFSLAGLMNGIFARKFDDLVIVPTFILTPLIYLGGVFFNVSELPTRWQIAAYVNPVHYLIDAFRYAMLGVTPGESMSVALTGIILFVLALFGANWFLMSRGVGLKS